MVASDARRGDAARPPWWFTTVLGFAPLVCLGCPATPPAPQEQRTVSRWITVEPAASPDAERPAVTLDFQDVEAIVATVPTISTLTTERLRTATIHAGAAEAEVQICSTDPEYLNLLRDVAGVELRRGRFLSDQDAVQSAAVVVLDEHLAYRLFGGNDPIGASIEIGGQAVTVIGVVGGGHEPLIDAVGHAAYLPRELVLRAFVEHGQDTTRLDRVYVQVESLDRVEDTRSVVLNLLERRRPGREVSVR